MVIYGYYPTPFAKRYFTSITIIGLIIKIIINNYSRILWFVDWAAVSTYNILNNNKYKNTYTLVNNRSNFNNRAGTILQIKIIR